MRLLLLCVVLMTSWARSPALRVGTGIADVTGPPAEVTFVSSIVDISRNVGCVKGAVQNDVSTVYFAYFV